ncbi:hypothetical protein [Arcticibacter sp.]|uniref:hypothetical protein n=1 Tax=Arcticibacter sp. TaxID=1872630 RepID=UPI00388F7268
MIEKKEEWELVADPRINERFKAFRLEYISKQGFKAAELLGISATHLSSIETKKRQVSSKIITTLMEKYKLNPEWLLSGYGYQRREEEYMPNTLRKRGENLVETIDRLVATYRTYEWNQTRLDTKVTKLTKRVEELERQLAEIRTPDVHQE